uniref:uncharacterized protein LOC109951534 n=1 Tax=Monopterus albus TaxID=43700 RepID=UPI0009B3DDF2|nr:uncharacterized protein LOC109951534 [Monopterus albus]
MSALWFGPGKPSIFTLLTPFLKEASLLETEGVDWQDIEGNRHVSKVYVLICSSDSVAQPLLRNTKQFNGFYGCDFCYHKGGKTYPYDRPEPPLRNEKDHFEKIKPPVEITRTPRSLSERKFWKASEWRAFLLFYALPILKGILPVRFWNNLFLLVFSIYTLLQDTIKTRSILMAEVALKKFVIEFQRLYGKNHMTFNIHLLTHVTQSVKHWGPLWATSTFPFESNMGTLLKYFHGTQYVPSQIARKFLMWRELPEKAKHTIASGNTKVQSFVEKLYVSKRRTDKCDTLNKSIKGFDHPPLQENIPASHRLAIVKLCGNLSNCFWYYSRFLVDGALYHSQTYDRIKKRFNSAVYLKDGQLDSQINVQSDFIHESVTAMNCVQSGRDPDEDDKHADELP